MNRIKGTRSKGSDGNPGGVVILENSPVGESQSNGLVEKAVQEVQYQIRKMKMQLEQNMASKLSNDSPIWPWLIQYAAQVIHTFKITQVISEHRAKESEQTHLSQKHQSLVKVYTSNQQRRY